MKRLLALFGLSILSVSAHAQDEAYIATEGGMWTIINLIVDGGFLIGMVLFVHGLYSFYKHGEQPQQYPVGYCFANLLAGTLLIVSAQAYAWTVNSVSEVNWATDSTMLSVSGHDDRTTAATDGTFLGRFMPRRAMSTLMGAVYLIGLVGFLRGLYLLKDTGKMDNQQTGGFAKAFWHIVGGCMTMNILQVGCFLSWLLGLSMLCAGT